MPTIPGIEGPYRLFFHSFDCREPMHVHDTDAVIRSVDVTDDEIVARLSDGRTIAVPLAWSWRLSDATPEQRQNFRLIGGGQGVHWPDVDEDISLQGMLQGSPAFRPG